MAEAQEWSPEQVRPGQVRRDLKRSASLRIDKIEDGSAHGFASDLDGAGTTSVSILGVGEVSQMPLVSDPEVPTWRVSAPLPIGQAETRIYDEIGTFVAGQSQSMTSGGTAGPRVQIEVVAPDAETAKERVAEISSRVGPPVSPSEITADRTARPERASTSAT